ncbi:DUF6010 family protein [Micromonospora tulbaghiae]|uniref:DUF6010 family protein n=1 Tax=Micromonospora tulbaghiae TaxID=479978 RepID=UPI003711C259
MLRYVMPVVIGLVYAGLNSLVPEPHRRRLNALVVTGAGAAYISGGGFGLWELAFCALLLVVGYAGLTSYTFIGVGWLLHTAWDVLHHRRGTPIIPSLHDSSFGCALCDPVIALWCLTGGLSVKNMYHRLRRPASGTRRPVPTG